MSLTLASIAAGIKAYQTQLLIGGGLGLYLGKQFYNGGKCKEQRDMTGKTVLITGGNRGIGKECALDLAKRGARIIFACRGYDTLDVIDSISKSTNNSKLEFIPLDLSDLDNVRKFASRFNAENQKLDILINNAGVYELNFKTTKQGFEYNFGVNHLGHFLLTNLLLDKIKNTPQSRIVVVSSRAHLRCNQLDLSTINNQTTTGLDGSLYPKSKLSNVLFVNELADRLKGTESKVVTLHPGVVMTSLLENATLKLPNGSLYLKLLSPLIWFVTKSEFYGAQTTLTCCYTPFEKLVNGGYYRDNKLYHTSEYAKNKDIAKSLWDYSAKAVQLENVINY